MMDCLFCKIISGEIPSEKVYEDESILAFKDINPMSKEHYLFIHKSHSKNIVELTDSNSEHITSIFKAISKFTKEKFKYNN